MQALSNYDGEHMKQAAAILKDLHCPYIINQNRYSIFDRTIEKNGLKQGSRSRRKGSSHISPSGTGNSDGPLPERYPGGQPYCIRTEDS